MEGSKGGGGEETRKGAVGTEKRREGGRKGGRERNGREGNGIEGEETGGRATDKREERKRRGWPSMPLPPGGT